MSPRDIQFRIRSGASLADVVAASGLPAERVEAFAAPILAERDHATTTALASPVRRRGETASARRLRPTVAEALLDQGQDIDQVAWDSWRRSDGRWILSGTWSFDGHTRTARFLFDPKGRFSVAENDLARRLVGDLTIGVPREPESEPTVPHRPAANKVQANLADETTLGLTYAESAGEPGEDDSVRSDIDLLYDMISTIDEDSVRIFRGLREPFPSDQSGAQPSLIDVPPAPAATSESPRPRGRRRATVPSWDDIIFGGRS